MPNKLREEVAIQILKSLKHAIGFGEYKKGHWRLMTEKERQVYLEMADDTINLIKSRLEGLAENEVMDKMDMEWDGYNKVDIAVASSEATIQKVKNMLGGK